MSVMDAKINLSAGRLAGSFHTIAMVLTLVHKAELTRQKQKKLYSGDGSALKALLWNRVDFAAAVCESLGLL